MNGSQSFLPLSSTCCILSNFQLNKPLRKHRKVYYIRLWIACPRLPNERQVFLLHLTLDAPQAEDKQSHPDLNNDKIKLILLLTLNLFQ